MLGGSVSPPSSVAGSGVGAVVSVVVGVGSAVGSAVGSGSPASPSATVKYARVSEDEQQFVFVQLPTPSCAYGTIV